MSKLYSRGFLNYYAELFDSRSTNSPASMMALQLQAALLKEKDPRKRGADHLWSASDDALLKSSIDKYPNNWALISECFNACRLTISIDRRTPRDCLERWKEKWGPEIRQRPGDSPMVTEDSTPASSQMTTRGVKRLASVSISTPSTVGVIPGSEPRKRRRHQLVQESIRKASKKRAELMQKALGKPSKSSCRYLLTSRQPISANHRLYMRHILNTARCRSILLQNLVV